MRQRVVRPAGSLFRKRVLLVTRRGSRRNLRSAALNQSGVDVICADDVPEARTLWHPASFDLVLFDCSSENDDAEQLCREIKAHGAAERTAFLVGKPEYLAAVPGAANSISPDESVTARLNPFRSVIGAACTALPQRHGFMEAIWRMQLLRSSHRPPAPAAPVRAEHPEVRPAAEALAFGEAIRRAEIAQEVALDPQAT